MKKFIFLFFLVLQISKTAVAQNAALSYYNSVNQISKPILSGAASFTIEFWIKTSSYPENLFGLTPYTVVDIANSNNDTNRFRLTCAKGELLHFQLDNKTIFRSNNMVADLQWHHVAFIYDSAAYKQYTIYIDGNLDTSHRGPALNLNKQNIFRLGSDLANNYRLEGALDEFRIFNHVRSDSAINADMYREFCNVNGMGLLTYYKFNDGVPLADNRKLSILYDFSGNGNHLSYSGFSLRGSCWGSCGNFVYGPTLSGGNTRDTIHVFSCDTVRSPGGTKYWTSTGKYFDTLVNANGCDSIILVNVQIGNSLSLVYYNICDSFKTPLGKVIKNDTLIYETYNAYKGCDSTVYYDISIRKKSINNLTLAVCDSFVSPKGNSYLFSGIYDEKYINYKGCDSIVRYHLTVYNDVNTFEYTEACDIGNIKGEWFNTSTVKAFNYNSYKGCDSTHYVILTINKSKFTTVKATACDSFVSPQGKVYKQTGLYNEVLRTTKNCDSTVTYSVTIHKSKHLSADISVCRGISINGNWYTESGDVTYYGKTSQGCDSIVDIQLTVKKTDRTITRIGNTLEANQSDAIYQWISCGNFAVIPFQSKQQFTPQFDGDYAVVILYNDCRDTSECISFRRSSTNALTGTIKASILPNPNDGKFELLFNEHTSGAISILDMTGRVLEVMPVEGKQLKMEVSLPRGIYIIELTGSGSRWILVID